MPEGPLGLPRPLSEIEFHVTKNPLDVDIKIRGPIGFRRPFGKASKVTEEDIQECMESKAAHNFARGMMRAPTVPNDKIESATKSWCEGILESTTEPTNDPADILPDKYIPPEGEVIDVEGETIDSTDQSRLPEGEGN